MAPDEIPVHDISHLIFAFGFITPEDFKVTNMPDVRPDLFQQVTYLKNKNSDLVIQIALGGWSHNDPGKWQPVFSDLVSTQEKRANFIMNLLGFMSQYGFDGVDFDWEYPGAEERGGKKEDGANYTLLLQELRQAIQMGGKNYIVKFTAPTSYWYLRHFDVTNMVQYVDWINLMSYDLHGTWDAQNPIGNQVLGHTNITEVDLALDLFWRNGVSPGDIVLGIGFYGRSFKLENANCWKPGCPFTAGGDKGECTNTAGFLSYSEVMNILSSTNAKPIYDKEAKVNYLVYGQNNWISYDDRRTFQDKIDFANDRGLNGLMIWAIDLDDSKHSALSALTGTNVTADTDPLALEDSQSVKHTTDDASQCRVTNCGSVCENSERTVGRVKSKDGKNACSDDPAKARYICCPAWTSLTPESCHWDAGGGNVKTDCSGKCKVGEIKVLGDSYRWEGDLTTGKYGFRCLRGGKIFCCNAGNMKRYLDICSWTKCGDKCPSDKQNVLTWDAGGPSGQGDRCDNYEDGDIFGNTPAIGDASDATKGTKGKRKLCCPKKDSFTGCVWKNKKVCSEQCDAGQITLDLDPQGQGGRYCDNGRQQAFCCNAPGKKDQPFLPVDLDKIFPSDYLPPPDTIPQFELVNFNGLAGLGASDPDKTGVAFFLIAGSEKGLSSMSKRDNPGLHFLDCPADIGEAPIHQQHTARIICVDGSEAACFGVANGGVEGTIVHLPTDCGNGSYARAVSLVPSQNQSVTVEVALQDPTSAVYDFTFDYDMGLVRRDAGKYSIRMDYSNVQGYWNSVVDSEGVKKRGLKQLVDRFYSSKQQDWFDKFNSLDISDSSALSDISKGNIQHLVFFDSQMCTTSTGQTGQGIAATIDGTLDVHFYYGFSLVATWDPAGKVEVHESAGFLHPSGTTSATYTVAGIGTLDTSKKLSGSSISKSTGKKSIGGHSLFKGWASFVPYKEESVKLKSFTGISSEVSFNGYMEVKAQVDWNAKAVDFPATPNGGAIGSIKIQRNSTMTPIGKVVPKSTISLSNTVTLGLGVGLAIKDHKDAVDGKLPDMSVTQTVTAIFLFDGDDNQICLDTSVFASKTAGLTNGASVGWDSTYSRTYHEQKTSGDEAECFKAAGSKKVRSDSLPDSSDEDEATTDETDEKVAKKKKRQNNSHHRGDYSDFDNHVVELKDLINKEASGLGFFKIPENVCDDCGNCLLNVKGKPTCCGCVWLPPDQNYLGSMSDVQANLRRSIFDEPMSPAHDLRSVANHKGIRLGRKQVTFWDTLPFTLNYDPRPGEERFTVESEQYASFPDYYRNPESTADWDQSDYTTGIKSYFHNASAACDSFDVVQSPTHDWAYPWPKLGYDKFPYVVKKKYHALYQTEHVFEGQTVARFFSTWLPSLSNGHKHEAFWTESYVLSIHASWPANAQGGRQAFVHFLVDELGSKDHPERLTVFMTRPNAKKGNLFSGKAAVAMATFAGHEAGAEQLLIAREIGYIFIYMNMNTVWELFCDAYNGMYDQMKKFDTWYHGLTGAESHLADEWPLFIRSELDMVVKQARMDLKNMYDLRKTAGLPYTNWWGNLMRVNGGEIQKVKLDRTDKCQDLPASKMGPFTG